MTGVLCALMVISYSPGFLTYYPGAAASAMAGAQVALADDAFANIYNPAGLGFQSVLSGNVEYNTEATFFDASMHTWLATAAIPVVPRLTAGVFGRGWVYQSVVGYPDSIQYLMHEFTFGCAMGYRLGPRVGFGLALKYLGGYAGASSFTPALAHDGAVDAGFRGEWPLWLGKLGIGAALQNLGPPYRWTRNGTQEAIDTLPLSVRAGISYVVTMDRLAPGLVEMLFRHPADWWAEHWRVVIAGDIYRIITNGRRYSFPCDWGNQSHSLGVEIRPVPYLAFRFGHFDRGGLSYAGGWTIGLGLDMKYLRLDIADDEAMLKSGYARNQYRRLRWTLGVELDRLLNTKRHAASPERPG